MAAQVGKTRELSDRMRANVMAMGELLATVLGRRVLERPGHCDRLGGCAHGAARRAARRHDREGQSPVRHLRLLHPIRPCRTGARSRVVITQGFIAANDGRGHGAARPWRLGHVRRVFRGQACAQCGSRSGPTCRACSAPIRATMPTARLLRALHYDEAQEIASNGAKVLHPRCILPVRQYRFRCTSMRPRRPGSRAR